VLFFNDKLTDLKRKELLNNLKLAPASTSSLEDEDWGCFAVNF
jgi:hypothetical protein